MPTLRRHTTRTMLETIEVSDMTIQLIDIRLTVSSYTIKIYRFRVLSEDTF